MSASSPPLDVGLPGGSASPSQDVLPNLRTPSPDQVTTRPRQMPNGQEQAAGGSMFDPSIIGGPDPSIGGQEPPMNGVSEDSKSLVAVIGALNPDLSVEAAAGLALRVQSQYLGAAPLRGDYSSGTANVGDGPLSQGLFNLVHRQIHDHQETNPEFHEKLRQYEPNELFQRGKEMAKGWWQKRKGPAGQGEPQGPRDPDFGDTEDGPRTAEPQQHPGQPTPTQPYHDDTDGGEPGKMPRPQFQDRMSGGIL